MSDSAPKLREIFGKALECPSQAEQDSYLAEACGGDSTLRAEVESLLRAHTDAGSFLAHPSAVVGEAVQQARGHGPADNPATEKGTKHEELSLDFLAPAQKAGALGRLGHYDVFEMIGRGGMGVVLKAFDDKLQRVVAIKAMLPQLATSATARQRFVREAQAAAAIRNEHVIDIHAVEEAAGLPYLVMEYISGVSLQERLDRSRLQLKEVLRIGMQTARGLAAAHAQGVIHRDVKPANILLENSVERVKITDFGLARTVDDASLTQSGVIAGTPHFMAPEQARGERVDHRADLFSLGSLLYVMCAGRPPFRAESTMGVLKRVCEETPHPIQNLNPDVPDWLVALITRLHAKDPAERLQSAAEVAGSLENGLAHLHQPSVVAAPSVGVRPSANDRGSRRRWVIAAVAVVVSVAGILVALSFFFGWNRDPEGDRPIVPDAAPFAVLARDGKPDRPFATLAEAVAGAASGDIIEIRGDGPFVVQPIDLQDKPLTLHAGAGSRPVIALAPQAVAADLPLLTTRAALTLEGLEFQRDAGGKPGTNSLRHIHSERAPLAVANCRFVLPYKHPGLIAAIRADDSPTVQVHNCLFLGDWHAGPTSFGVVTGSRMVVANCLFLTRHHAVTLGPREEGPTASFQVLNNTMIGQGAPIAFSIGPNLGKPLKENLGPPPFRLEIRRNLGATGLLHFLYFSWSKETDDYFEREMRSLPARLFTLEDQGNHIAAGSPLVTFRMLKHGGGDHSKPDITKLEEYQEYWKLGKVDSIPGLIRLQKGLSPKTPAPEKLSAEDFRLLADGPGAKDLGADVDLVGPGPAYERWKKTPHYQQWLKDKGAKK